MKPLSRVIEAHEVMRSHIDTAAVAHARRPRGYRGRTSRLGPSWGRDRPRLHDPGHCAGAASGPILDRRMELRDFLPGIIGSFIGVMGWLLVGLYIQRRQFLRQGRNAAKAVYF